jgi:hypothetical protein
LGNDNIYVTNKNITMRYRGFKIESDYSTNYKGDVRKFWSCKIDKNCHICKNTLEDLQSYIDYLVDNAIHIAACREQTKRGIEAFYADRDNYIYND